VTGHAAGARRIRVLVVDDHSLVRDAVRSALQDDPAIEAVGVARSAAEALSVARATCPDVIVLDYRLPDGDAPEVIGRLREQGSAAEVVVLSGNSERRNIRAALDHGARAFLTKRATDLERVARAVRDAAEGKSTLSEDALSEFLSSVRDDSASVVAELTAREREIWRLVAHGKSNSEIAAAAFITERTVKYHVSNLLSKTGTKTRTELVAKAYTSGLMDATT
jgi:DNA-binding NarL/FixJ family response regulator